MPSVKTLRSSPEFLGSALWADRKKTYCWKPSSDLLRSTPKQIVLIAEKGRLKLIVVFVRLIISKVFNLIKNQCPHRRAAENTEAGYLLDSLCDLCASAARK